MVCTPFCVNEVNEYVMKVVPDTSAVIDGRVSEYLETELVSDAEVLIPEAVVGELEAQANDGRETGLDGLSELQRLTDLADETGLTVEYVGEGVTPGETAHAAAGGVDAVIRSVAEEHDGTLLTSDVVQSEVADAKDIDVEYIEPETTNHDGLAVEEFFDEDTMSVHLKTDTRPKAKRGSIGEMRYEQIRDTVTGEERMRELADDIEASVHTHPESFMDLSEPGMSIVQYEDYRIAVARPPFAEAIEITAVRPISKTGLDDYAFAEEFRDRFTQRQRGVLIAGAPGAGKSTFAQAVAEFLSDEEYVVKTMEKPRDLQVGPDITQYTELAGTMEKTADSLLLVRPDYTIYDEVRKTDDFEVFSDMRLAGVGMVGVVHATRAIDALQRLVGRVELGMIPQIVDTVVFIEAGDVHTVYDVTTTVKVPHGIEAEDLARPVIHVENFETGDAEYEIYTFNGEVVTSPLDEDAGTGTGAGSGEGASGVFAVAEQELADEVRSLTSGVFEVDVTGEDTAVVYVEESDISHVIGSHGSQIQEVEDRFDMHIDVQPLSELDTSDAGVDEPLDGTVIEPEMERKSIVFPLDEYEPGEAVEVQCEGEYLLTATVSHEQVVSVNRGSNLGQELENAIANGHRVHIKPV